MRTASFIKEWSTFHLDPGEFSAKPTFFSFFFFFVSLLSCYLLFFRSLNEKFASKYPYITGNDVPGDLVT